MVTPEKVMAVMTRASIVKVLEEHLNEVVDDTEPTYVLATVLANRLNEEGVEIDDEYEEMA
jgi:hypothetical protein